MKAYTTHHKAHAQNHGSQLRTPSYVDKDVVIQAHTTSNPTLSPAKPVSVHAPMRYTGRVVSSTVPELGRIIIAILAWFVVL